MSDIASVLSDLTQASLQMKQAALTQDWDLAKRIQTRRSGLVGELVALAEGTPLSPDELAQLDEIRQIEAELKSRALAGMQSVGEALEQLRRGVRAKRRNRVQEAYGSGGPKP